MISNVNWQYILLNGDSTVGYRVKRRKGGSLPPIVASGTDTPMSDHWVSAPAPPQIHYVPDGRDYIFVFWSLSAYDTLSHQSAAQIQAGNIANDSHTGGQWTITAKAYYVWNFGNIGGDNALLIDAFDVQAGDFIPDDFVDVKPDPNGKLTVEANNGYIDTTTEIAQIPPPPPAITVTARDMLPSKKFAYWLYWPNVSPLFYIQDPNFPPTVGTPKSHDIVVHYNDVVVAIAIYDEVPPRLRVPAREYIYDPWWWIETRGGLVPPPPPPPWLQEFGAAAALADVANRVSPQLRARVLEVALEQVSIASAAIRNDIKRLQER
jgi:hypothetical protein